MKNKVLFITTAVLCLVLFSTSTSAEYLNVSNVINPTSAYSNTGYAYDNNLGTYTYSIIDNANDGYVIYNFSKNSLVNIINSSELTLNLTFYCTNGLEDISMEMDCSETTPVPCGGQVFVYDFSYGYPEVDGWVMIESYNSGDHNTFSVYNPFLNNNFTNSNGDFLVKVLAYNELIMFSCGNPTNGIYEMSLEYTPEAPEAPPFNSSAYNVSFPYLDNAYTNNASFTYGFTTSDPNYNHSVYTLSKYGGATTNTSVKGKTSYCYQESTNTSNQSNMDGGCGLNYNGSYATTNNWRNEGNPAVTVANLYDGDWVYSVGPWCNFECSAKFYSNYTKPSNSDVVGATWTMEYYTNVPGTYAYHNFTIPSSCFNAYPDKIMLLYDGNSVWKFNLSCYNGSNWELIFQQSHAAYNSYLTEEAIYWELDEYVTTFPATISKTQTLTEGKYYYALTIFDNNGDSEYYDPNITLDTTNPSIIINNNSTFNSSPSGTIYISINSSDENIALTEINLYDGTNTLINTTNSTTNGTLELLVTNLTSGVYYYNATVIDLANNTNKTSTYTVYAITSFNASLYTVTFPYANEAVVTNNNLTYGFTTTDPYYSHATYTLLNYTNNITTNHSTTAQNKSQILADGKYYYALTIFDLAGNSQYYDPNITIDATPPSLNYVFSPLKEGLVLYAPLTTDFRDLVTGQVATNDNVEFTSGGKFGNLAYLNPLNPIDIQNGGGGIVFNQTNISIMNNFTVNYWGYNPTGPQGVSGNFKIIWGFYNNSVAPPSNGNVLALANYPGTNTESAAEYYTLTTPWGPSWTDTNIDRPLSLSMTTVTFNGTNLLIYINGSVVYNATGFTPRSTPIPDFALELLGCSHQNGYDCDTNERLGEVGVWNRTLSPTEVSSGLFNSGSGRQYTSFDSYLGPTSSTLDSSYLNTGTIYVSVNSNDSNFNATTINFYNSSGGLINPDGIITITNLSAYYPFDVDAKDYTGKNNGTASNVWFSTGKINNSYNFSSVNNSYIVVSDSNSLDLTNSFSINVWVKQGSQNSGQIILSKSASPSAYPRYSLGIMSDGAVESYAGDGISRQGNVHSAGGSVPNDGQWHMITLVHAGSGAGQHRFYVDGVSKTNATTYDSIADSGSLYIGRWYGSGNDYTFNGSIDDLALWQTTLTDVQIQNLYNSGNGKYVTEWGSNATTSNPGVHSLTYSNLPNGVYYWNATSTDTLGQITSTRTYKTTIINAFQSSLYTVTFPYTNNAYTTNKTLTYGFTKTDPSYGFTTYNLTPLATNVSNTSIRLATSLTQNLSDGKYYYALRITDRAGNNQYYDPNVTIDTTPPIISYAGLNQELVSYWKFDEGTGSTLYDSVGDNDVIKAGNDTWNTTSKNGTSSLQCPKIPDNVQGQASFGNIILPENSSQSDITLCAWIYPEAQNYFTFYQSAISIGKYGSSPAGMLLGRDNNNRYYMMWSGYGTIKTSYNVTNDAWTLECGIWHQNNNTLDFYVNGTLIGNYSGTGSFAISSNTNISFCSGTDNNGYSYNHFYGKVDEAMLWTRSLSSAELTKLMNGGLPGAETLTSTLNGTYVGSSQSIYVSVDTYDTNMNYTVVNMYNNTGGVVEAEIGINTSNLVAYYTMDGVTTDYTGRYNATSSNATSVIGKYNLGYQFPGGQDTHITIPYNAGLVPLGNYTMNIWVKQPTTGNNDLFTMAAAPAAYPIYNIKILTTGALSSYFGSSQYTSATGKYPADGQWHMVTMVHEGTGSNQHKVYIDGVSVWNATIGNLGLGPTNPLRIGTWYPGSGSPNTINLDDFIIMNASMTQEEVLTLYNTSRPNRYTTSNGVLGVNFTGLSKGAYYWNATAYDLAGLTTSTPTYTAFVIGNFSPELYNVSFPYLDEVYTSNNNLTYGFSTTDPYYSYTTYSLTNYSDNLTTNTSTADTTKTQILTDGKYYYGLTIFDLGGNSQYYDPNITIDTTNPSIEYTNTSTQNNTYISSQSILVEVNVNDTNINTTTINLYNSSGLVSSSDGGVTNYNGFVSSYEVSGDEGGTNYISGIRILALQDAVITNVYKQPGSLIGGQVFITDIIQPFTDNPLHYWKYNSSSVTYASFVGDVAYVNYTIVAGKYYAIMNYGGSNTTFYANQSLPNTSVVLQLGGITTYDRLWYGTYGFGSAAPAPLVNGTAGTNILGFDTLIQQTGNGVYTSNFTNLPRGTNYYWNATTNDLAGNQNSTPTYTSRILLFNNGTGSLADPYQITNCAELQEVQYVSGANFSLTNNIDCSDTMNWNSGEGFIPLYLNGGVFDGNNHTISNLFINRTGSFQGLFSINNYGTITNLGVINASINLVTPQRSGILAGQNTYGTISNCYVTGKLTMSGYSLYNGGLVGFNRGTISNSYNRANVTGGSQNIGGLVGYNSLGSVSNSFSTGRVYPFNIYDGKGGLVGYTDSGSVSNSFWDNETSNASISSGGTGKTTYLMKTTNTFIVAGWDLNNTWQVCPDINDGYPSLRVFGGFNESTCNQERPFDNNSYTVNFPYANEAYTSNNTLTYGFTTIDPYFSYASYLITNLGTNTTTNTSTPNTSHTTILADGKYYYALTLNDFLGKGQYYDPNITIDTINPMISYYEINCYQEDPVISNQSGLDGNCAVYTGAITFRDQSSDGNWGTDNFYGLGYMNYTKPISAASTSKWKIGSYYGSGDIEYNIPLNCWNAYSNKLVFRVTSTPGPRYWDCYDGSSWNTIYTTGVSNAFREEAMVWHIGTTTPNNTYVGSSKTIKVGINVSDINLDSISINLYNSTNLVESYSPSNTPGSCYQESTNIINQSGQDGPCNLEYTGAYIQQYPNGTTSVYTGCANNGLFEFCQPGIDNDIYINYTKPIGATSNSKIDVLIRTEEGTQYNQSIPSSCWNYDPNTLVLARASSFGLLNGGFGGAALKCYNGSSWLDIYNSGQYTLDFGEEAVRWDIGSTGSGVFTNDFTNLTNGVYYWNATAVDLAGLTNSTPTWMSTVHGAFEDNLYTVTFPYPDETYTTNNTLVYGFSTIDPFYDYAEYTLHSYTNGTTQNTSTSNQNITHILPDGKYYYGLTIYDLANNYEYYDPNITIDTIYPTISYNPTTTPNNSYVGPSANIYVSLSMNDTNINTTTINLYNSTLDLINTSSVTGITSNTYLCYQESMNISDQTGIDGDCDQVYNGNYTYGGTGVWSPSTAPLYDGDWNTGASVASQDAYVTVTYTMPPGTNPTSSIWQIKDGQGLANLSLINCSGSVNQTLNTISLGFWRSSFNSDVFWSCSNSTGGTEWLRITTNNANSVYEEAMYWNVTSNSFNVNFTNLPNGVYYFNASVNDYVGYTNNTETRTATIISSFQSQHYTNSFPYTDNEYTTNNTLTHGFTTIDPYYAYTTYTLLNYNTANTTNTSTPNTSISYVLPDAKYYYGLRIYDLAGNNQYYDPNITIDTTYPSLVYNANTTTNNSYVGPSANIYVSVNMSDANINFTEIRLYNSTLDLINSTSSTSNGTLSINFTDLTNDVYYWNVSTSDYAGLITNLQTMTATIISSFQSQWYNVTFPYPEETYTTNNTLTYGFETTDPYYATTTYTLTNYSNNITTNVSVIDKNKTQILADGKYYYGLRIYDLAGNNQYYDPNVTIDTTNPLIEFINFTDINGSTVDTRLYLETTVNTSDTNYYKTDIYMYNSTGLQEQYTTYTPGIINHSFNISTNGWYYLNATTTDYAGLTNSTETREVLIDTFKTNITFSGYERTTNNTIPFNVIIRFATNYTTQTWTNTTVNDGTQTYTNPENAFDGNTGTYASLSGVYADTLSQLGKTFNESVYISNLLWNVRYYRQDGGSYNSVYIYLDTYNGTTWNQQAILASRAQSSAGVPDTPASGTYALNTYTKGVRIRATTGSSGSTNTYVYIYELTPTIIPDTIVTPGNITANVSVTNRTLTTSLIKSTNDPHEVTFTAGGNYYNCTQNWFYQSNYEFTPCEFYTTNTTIYAYNSYTDQQISGFTVNTSMPYTYPSYSEQQTANTTNITFYLTNQAYALSLSHPYYLGKTKTYTPSGLTETLNESMNQSSITLRFVHVYSDELITNINITVNDTSVPHVFNTNQTGMITFNPNTGNHTLVISGDRYNQLTYNLVVTDQDTRTIDISLYPILNISVYEEKQSMIALSYFNFSHPRQAKWTVYCLNSSGDDIGTQQAIISNSTTGAYFLNATCYYERVKFDLEYLNGDGTTTNYYRNVIFNPTITLFDFRTFLPDLALGYNIYPTTLKPYDIFGVYTPEEKTQVQVTKIMPTGTELITSDYVDAEGKITAYLIAGDTYIITIIAENQPTRVLGPYSADSSGTKILRLFDVTLISDIDTQDKDISMITRIANQTDNQSLLIMYFSNHGEWAYDLTMTMYNGTCDDPKLTTSCSLTPNAGCILTTTNLPEAQLIAQNRTVLMTTNVFGSPYMNKQANTYYCALYNYTDYDGVVHVKLDELTYDHYIRMPAKDYMGAWTMPWIILLIIVVIALGLNVRTVSYGSLLITFLAMLLYGWGWFNGVTDIAGLDTGLAFTVAILIAIAFNIKRQM